ncbi:hypothetical protein CYMTET_48309 [Cymbomonas tetramitiformis]|uniref:Uncharacterized protein n=1 Tax=Cymbomonas tetramitiformis TaxID=36881 RepID=A0AAE0BSM0_9CHLO|nr:hypothetical protein CYMTET_48309 [Cymbomonas tetramitiformis]
MSARVAASGQEPSRALSSALFGFSHRSFTGASCSVRHIADSLGNPPSPGNQILGRSAPTRSCNAGRAPQRHGIPTDAMHGALSKKPSIPMKCEFEVLGPALTSLRDVIRWLTLQLRDQPSASRGGARAALSFLKDRVYGAVDGFESNEGRLLTPSRLGGAELLGASKGDTTLLRTPSELFFGGRAQDGVGVYGNNEREAPPDAQIVMRQPAVEDLTKDSYSPNARMFAGRCAKEHRLWLPATEAAAMLQSAFLQKKGGTIRQGRCGPADRQSTTTMRTGVSLWPAKGRAAARTVKGMAAMQAEQALEQDQGDTHRTRLQARHAQLVHRAALQLCPRSVQEVPLLQLYVYVVFTFVTLG